MASLRGNGIDGKDYFRPRGDITTVLDLTDRDAQDNVYFPIDTDGSSFHHHRKKSYPTSVSVQEFTQRGPAQWGGRFSFEIGSLHAGDLLQSVALQITLGHWYNSRILYQLYRGELTIDLVQHSDAFWTYANSLGTSIIEYADFIVNEQRVERITGEWIRTYLTLGMDSGSLIGIASDAVGATPVHRMNTANVVETAFHPRRPYPVEDGTYYCILPFFFARTALEETFPLLSCNEGSVRIDIKLRSFEDMVRRFVGYRRQSDDSPLGKTVPFTTTAVPSTVVESVTATCAPEFRDFRIITSSVLLTGGLRQAFLHRPFEQMMKFVQIFSFEEPLKYLVSKPNAAADRVDIQLPLELNHPVTELIWVFRRKGVRINNEWSNFTVALERESSPSVVYPAWLDHATIRLNGQELISAEGDWFREHIASVHKGGIISYRANVYGYSFAREPEKHGPSGTGNMSRTSSVALTLRVRTPIARSLPVGAQFDREVVEGWEVFVFAVHYNWLRFQNGLCSRLFSD